MSKVKGEGHSVKVMYQQQKSYTAWCSNFKLGVASYKAGKDRRGVGRPQVAMHSQLPRFLVEIFPYAAQIISSFCLKVFRTFRPAFDFGFKGPHSRYSVAI